MADDDKLNFNPGNPGPGFGGTFDDAPSRPTISRSAFDAEQERRLLQDLGVLEPDKVTKAPVVAHKPLHLMLSTEHRTARAGYSDRTEPFDAHDAAFGKSSGDSRARSRTLCTRRDEGSRLQGLLRSGTRREPCSRSQTATGKVWPRGSHRNRPAHRQAMLDAHYSQA